MFSSIESGPREQEEQSPQESLREAQNQLREQIEICKAEIDNLREDQRENGGDNSLEISVKTKELNQLEDQLDKLITQEQGL